MNSEITENNAEAPAGWIFYDAECRACVASRRRWGRIFERRGFVWLPLQTPGAAERLGAMPHLLMAKMWVLPAGDPQLNGVDAWIELMGHVWWLKPVAWTMDLPGLNRLARATYCWMARNRYCIAGRCGTTTRQGPGTHRHSAFFELP